MIINTTVIETKFKKVTVIGFTAIAFFILAIILNLNHEYIIDDPSGNLVRMVIFVPFNIIALILSLIVIVKTIYYWSEWHNTTMKVILLTMTIPITLLWVILLLKTILKV